MSRTHTVPCPHPSNRIFHCLFLCPPSPPRATCATRSKPTLTTVDVVDMPTHPLAFDLSPRADIDEDENFLTDDETESFE